MRGCLATPPRLVLVWVANEQEGAMKSVDAIGPGGRRSEIDNLTLSDAGYRHTAATVTALALLVLSSGLGLLRDLSLAGLFGASSDTYDSCFSVERSAPQIPLQLPT